MPWSQWFQFVFAMMLGAWVYSAGARHVSVIPGHEAIAKFGSAILSRNKDNGKQNVSLPRVSS